MVRFRENRMVKILDMMRQKVGNRDKTVEAVNAAVVNVVDEVKSG